MSDAESERDLLRKIASQVPGVVYLYRLRPDDSHCIPYASDAFRDVYGLPPEAVREDAGPAFALVHPDDLESVLASIRESQAKLTPWRTEFRLRFPDGETRWIAGNSVPQRDADGSTLWYGFLTDVTERKRTEEALRESYLLIQGIVNAMPARVFWKDMSLRYLGCNAAFARDSGFARPEDLVGKDDFQMSWREQAERYRADDRAVIMSGRPKLLIEEPQTTPDGRTIVLLTNKLPLRSSKGEIVGVLGTYMDITERRRNEEALANLQKLESLGTLAGGIAHDFNNILTAIAGNISLLQADRPGEAETRELLSEAQDACETAKGLSNQLLTFAKGGAPVAAVMDLRPVIERSAAFASRGSNARCAYALGDGPLAVKIDPSQIAQVVQNLVLNAVQAMPGGGEIELRAGSVDVRDGDDPRLAAGRYARVTVRDHGSGIEPRDLPRVFEPYFSTKAAGRGLGLSMCHSTMRRHGGDIRVESVPGRGTSFILHLPEAPPDAAPARTRAEEPRAGEGRVLVMDDEPTVARTLLRTLKSLGYRGDWVADGEAALNAYEQALKDSEPYAAVLMDLTIPGALGGKETAAQLKALHPEATAVVMSGYSNDPVLADHAAYGFAAALLKPFDRESVSAAMTAARVVRG